MQRPTLLVVASLLLSLNLASACVTEPEPEPESFEASFADEVLISYEGVPSAQYDHFMDVDFDAADYAAREALTVAVHEQIYPEILDAVAFDCAVPDTEVTPGGYLLETNPSLQSAISATDCTRAEIDELAAALGYVFRQWDVLVTDYADDSAGGTGFGIVEFGASALTPELAQSFFVHAGDTDEGLGGGYTAFGDRMVFLNLRGGDGATYSGLEDPDFIAALDDAAASFTEAELELVESGEGALEAWFVSNDWSSAVEGEDFATLFDGTERARLDELRAAHDQLVIDML